MKIIINKNYHLEYVIDDEIKIIDIKFSDKDCLIQLVNKLIVCSHHENKDIINNTNVDLSFYHFKNNKLNKDDYVIRRFFKIGDLNRGEKNNICDVNGVKVGSFDIHNDIYNTGITVIRPSEDNVFRSKVVASSYSFNGFGKSIGFVQIEELGTIETDIVFTATMNVGKVSDALISEVLKNNPEIGETTGTVNPIVMECNDSGLNKSRDRILGEKEFKEALNNLNDDFIQGDVGGGAGMVCHGFKGGLGSSSRVVNIDGKDYTIGIIVNSNFGSSNGEELIINGHKYKDLIKAYNNELQMDEKGSIVACVATDAPLNERQIKRLLKRVEIGIGRTGSFAGNGSGDVFVGFSTVNKRDHFTKSSTKQILYFNDGSINPLFKGVVEATEEAVLNSMMFAHHLKGYKKEVRCLGEDINKFYDLLSEEIEWKN